MSLVGSSSSIPRKSMTKPQRPPAWGGEDEPTRTMSPELAAAFMNAYIAWANAQEAEDA